MRSLFLKHCILANTLMIISVITIFTLSSCHKEKVDNEDEIKANDNYYVKYVIKVNGAYGRFSDWTVTTPEGIYTNSGYNTKSWNQTYGPVKKGFKCEVRVKSGAPTIEIHVSKNQEPFALKKTQTGSSTSYIIDF